MHTCLELEILGRGTDMNPIGLVFFLLLHTESGSLGGVYYGKDPQVVLTYTRGREKVWCVIFFCLYFLVISQLNFSMSLIFLKCSDDKNNSLKI